MTTAPCNVTQDDLEALFVNNAQLQEISAYLNRFNPIRVMRMEAMEIRHSAILAWLLDPIENHGFNDEFLRAFLAQALLGARTASPTALDVSQADLRDAEIQREKRNMDIFVSSPSNRWAFVIENKFNSKQREGQLAKYIERAKRDAKEDGLTFVHQGIFLTLHDEMPHEDALNDYVLLKYSDICEILSSLMFAKSEMIGDEVKQFLRHYLDVIRDAADMSEEQKRMEDLARQLYRSHKKALDFIMEHGISTDFTIAAEHIFSDKLNHGDRFSIAPKKSELEIFYNSHNQNTFSFLPAEWVDALGGNDKKPWKAASDGGLVSL